MIGYALWMLGRLLVVAFAFVTWAYCVSTYSPFAYDMFVGPRLFPWLETFVNWYHLWFMAAYAISALTLLPDLIGVKARANRPAFVAAALYILMFFGLGVHLLRSPYLRMLSTTTHGPATAFVALIPMLWLAVVDILATRALIKAVTAEQPATTPHQLLKASIVATTIVWAIHFVRALVEDPALRSDGLWAISGAWSFALDLTASAILFAVLTMTVALAGSRGRPAAREFGFGIVFLAVGVTEFCRRLVFPSLAFTEGDAAAIAIAFGFTIAATWCGWRLRRATCGSPVRVDVSLVLSPAVRSRPVLLILLIAIPVAALAIIGRVQPADWDFLIQKSVALLEGLTVFGLALRLQSARDPRSAALAWLVGLPVIAVALIAAVPRLTPAAEVIRDRSAVVDPLFRLTADAFIEQRAHDSDYATSLLAAAKRSVDPIPTPPHIDFIAKPAPAGPVPNIFLFVIDGLRRDYLSPYDDAVKFTPSIGEWARDALVFQNAFTKYGGTWLAMPSIWSGAPVRRAWSHDGLEHLNSLERLIVSNRYEFAINDFTVEGHLRRDTTRTFINPGIKSIDTDICANVAALEKLLPTGGAPFFSFVAPMNVYTLNSTHSAFVADPSSPYNGFSSGYAANVERVDRCFGEFIAFLKRSGIYDNSVIALSADHGESLGEGGHFGHQFFLFPEDVRIPLIVSLPARWRAGVTTDLARVAFSSDLVPTLYQLLGNEVRDLGDQFGSPLVTSAASELPSRRRQSYLLMSSYGASYAMLRRNGKFLFISDLINYREYAFDLFRQPVGTQTRVTDDLRLVNQRLIRRQVDGIEAFYARR